MNKSKNKFKNKKKKSRNNKIKKAGANNNNVSLGNTSIGNILGSYSNIYDDNYMAKIFNHIEFDSMVAIDYDYLFEKINDDNINLQYNGESLLYKAIEIHSIELVQFLLNYNNCDVNKPNTDEFGLLPINKAILNNRNDILEILLLFKADINLLNGNDELSINIALENIFDEFNTTLENYFIPILDTIFQNENFDPNIIDTHGNSPLHIACRYNCFSTFTQLMEKGANYNLVNNNLDNPLLLSYNNWSDDKRITNFLLDKDGIEINHQDHDGNTLLHYAVMFKDIKTIEKLFKLGIDVSIQNNDNQTACQLIPPPVNFDYTTNFPIMQRFCGREH